MIRPARRKQRRLRPFMRLEATCSPHRVGSSPAPAVTDLEGSQGKAEEVESSDP